MLLLSGFIGLLLGLCYKKAPKVSKICGCFHNLTSLLFTLIFLLFSFIFISNSSFGNDHSNILCNNIHDFQELPSNLSQDIANFQYYDKELIYLPSTYLCTDICPCPLAMNEWISKFKNSQQNEYIFQTFSERALLKFKRNFTVTTSIEDYQFLKKIDGNLPIFVNITDGAVTYSNFWDCYLKLINLESIELNKNPNYVIKFLYLRGDLETLIRKFESELSCNGICYPGIFFYFKDLEAGPPEMNCFSSFMNILQDKALKIGILLLISCFLTFLSHISSYYICMSCNKNDVKDDG